MNLIIPLMTKIDLN